MLKSIRYVPAWLVSLFRRCPQRLRRNDQDRPFLVIGHRGAPCGEVENTLPSFQAAIDAGVNGLELDLCLTRDNQIVLLHDWDPDDVEALARQAGLEPDVAFCPCPPESGGLLRRPVCELRLDDIRDHYCFVRTGYFSAPVKAEIITFDRFLEWAVEQPSLRTIFLDIKIPEHRVDLVPVMIACLDEIMSRYQPGFRIVLETPYLPVLLAMKRVRPTWEYSLDVQLTPGVLLDPRPHSAARHAIDHGHCFATLAAPYVSTIAPWTTFKRIVHHDIRLRERHNRKHPERAIESFVAFTINAESQMRCLVNMGIGGIQSDKPDLLRRVVDEIGVPVA